MPRGNGTGPSGGRGSGRGRGIQSGIGVGGNCVCPGCGKKIPHQRSVPCNQISCPNCGMKMIKEL